MRFLSIASEWEPDFREEKANEIQFLLPARSYGCQQQSVDTATTEPIAGATTPTTTTGGFPGG